MISLGVLHSFWREIEAFWEPKSAFSHFRIFTFPPSYISTWGLTINKGHRTCCSPFDSLEPEFAPEQIARGLALISGAFLLLVGLIRAGWIVEFIPLVSITSFMTRAAVSIAAGQVPTITGISGVDSRDPTFIVWWLTPWRAFRELRLMLPWHSLL